MYLIGFVSDITWCYYYIYLEMSSSQVCLLLRWDLIQYKSVLSVQESALGWKDSLIAVFFLLQTSCFAKTGTLNVASGVPFSIKMSFCWCKITNYKVKMVSWIRGSLYWIEPRCPSWRKSCYYRGAQTWYQPIKVSRMDADALVPNWHQWPVLLMLN